MGTDRRDGLSSDEILDEMAVLEPYTTGELAGAVGGPKTRIRELLERLSAAGTVRKKAPEAGRAIWIKQAPRTTCQACGQAAEIKFLHPVLAAARYCPRCGAAL